MTDRGQQEWDAERALLASIVESTDDAILSKTLDGIITSWNSAAERLYGYTAAEAIGQAVSLLIPEDHPDEMPRIIEGIRAGERVEHYETVRVRKDGARVHVSVTVSPITDAAGAVIGASAIARDITERTRAEEERQQSLAREQQARREAEEANRIKDEFLATISHELRTPLNSILGWARMLTTGRLDEAATERALEAISRNAISQTELVNDLLDVSRIITGKLRLDVRPLELAPIIQAAIDSVRPSADAKGIRLQMVLDPRAGPVLGDPERLQQIVWNLLSNATKFTPKGGRVQIHLERINSHVEFTVSDTGVGISEDFLPHVFDRFRQADGTITRQHGGLGLGLAIVRHLVELHGGSVSVESDGEGKGSTFTVKLPVLVVHRRMPDPERVQTLKGEAPSFLCPPELDGLRVLVVDDEPDTCELLAAILTQCGAKVRTVASAREALEQLDVWRPDTLVSDVGMPEMDGYELIRAVRRRPAGRGGSVPAVALTAYARVQDRVDALSSGFQLHVGKPVEPAELVAAIASTAARRRTQNAVPAEDAEDTERA